MRCPYCSAENRDGSTFCIFCGHALPAPSAHTPATPNYAFPHPGRAPNARMVGKGQFTLKSGIPLPSAMNAAPLQAPPANAATVADETAASASPRPVEAEAARMAPDPMLGLGRRAPYFDPAAFDALAHPPNWREAGPARSRKLTHLALLLCMFGVGLLSGAAALWWLNHPGGIEQTLSDWWPGRGLQTHLRTPEAAVALPEKMPPPEMTQTPPAPPAISAGELPYDGQAPAADSASAADNASSAPAPVRARSAAPAPAATPAPNTAASAAAEVKPPQKAQAVPIPAASRTRAAKSPKKRAGDSGGSMRGDTTIASAPATPRGTAAGERSLTPLMIAQCESMSNPKERAQCKLEVCRGKGGKNACPS